MTKQNGNPVTHNRALVSRQSTWRCLGAASLISLLGCTPAPNNEAESTAASTASLGLGELPTQATASTGESIAWVEHIIDDPVVAGFGLSGSDGLVVGDIDGDGFDDIVSVHESDSEYDSSEFDPDYIPDAEGHVRIAFRLPGSLNWTNITLAEGTEVPAPEDADIADVNGDGFLDVIVAAELSHLLYLQNPGASGARDASAWQRLVLPMTRGNGSYIRVFFADLDADGRPEAIAANKGAQRPGPEDFARSTPVSVFSVKGDPLFASNWSETVLGSYSVPQNSQPVDLDGDGDLDIVVGTRGENRLVWFENRSAAGAFNFIEHAIGLVGGSAAGFNLDYADIDGDGRLDIITAIGAATLPSTLAWLQQPATKDAAWISHPIGSIAPDSVTGISVADIDGDGDLDTFVGSYSSGSREDDGDVEASDALGRLAWFENPGAAPTNQWRRHDVSRRKRGMFDKFVVSDIDEDGDLDLYGTRGNSAPYDGVFWLEQRRRPGPQQRFTPARASESPEMPLPFLAE